LVAAYFMQIFAMNKLCDKMNIKPYATSLWSKYSYYILAIQITQTTFFNHIFVYISLYDRKYCYKNAGIVVCMHTQWFPWYNFISSWPIPLKFSHKDLWYIVMIGINLDYCSSTCFQTRGQRCDKECFWVFFVEKCCLCNLDSQYIEHFYNNIYDRIMIYTQIYGYLLYIIWLDIKLSNKL
jgi:hypothetical protein